MKNIEWNNLQKAIVALIFSILLFNLLAIPGLGLSGNPILSVVGFYGAQIVFIVFVYYALLWLKKG